MINILLCGGSGTRLWPISRNQEPKQFNKIFGNESLYQKTILRNSNSCHSFRVITGENHFELAKSQFEEVKIKNSSDFILEPVGRNTAPAIALAIKDLDPNEIVLVTPTDHLIKNSDEYNKVLSRAKELAQAGNLVTFGITPTHAETGYGYIKFEGEDVIAFVEKPGKEKAKVYVESKKYLWNSGMFCFKVSTFMEELKTFRSDIYDKSQIKFEKDGNVHKISREEMLNIPSESIDYAVMEKSKKVKVIESNIGWSDVGSFDALYEQLEKDEFGNNRAENHININSHNNLLIGKKLIATIDIENLMVIDTPDALLICKKGSGQKVKDVVAAVNEINPDLTKKH